MGFSIDKQKGFVFPAMWIAVLIGFISVTVIKNNEDPVTDVSEGSESYKQVGLKEIESKDVTTISITDEE